LRIRHPEPNGSRWATPPSLIQQRPGQSLSRLADPTLRCASLRRDERQRIGAHSITRARPSKSTAPPRPSGRVRRGRPRAVDNQKMSLRRQLLTVTITWLPAHRSRLVALRSVSSHSVRNKRHAAQEARLGVGLDGRGSSVGRNAADLQGALHCSSASLLELKAPGRLR
jgi:hypothetical protein